MIRIYYLPVETIDGTEQVAGIEFIHDAILECTVFPDIRLLIMNSAGEEHDLLADEAITWHEAPQETIDLYLAEVTITPPDTDIARAAQLLTNSPDVITQPEMWELLRIFGRLHDINF